MKQYYLAIDIGASSGRHILGHLEDDRLITEEIYRFENQIHDISDMKCWNIDLLASEVVEGMKKCRELGRIPVSVGIDTWGVDYVLLDQNGDKIGEAVSYRDERTQGVEQEVYQVISPEELYERTGIQYQSFNTIYQLMADKRLSLGERVQTMLMIPDYLHYLLAGVCVAEYTNATTTQLVNSKTNDWDYTLIRRLGLPEKIFQKIVQPGTCLGDLTEEMQQRVGYNCHVVIPATHDTASAVLAVPALSEKIAYISSGTWSLLGTELQEPLTSELSRQHNFTNEGGYGHTYRYLKNIMGLWMIQSIRREQEKNIAFSELCELAEHAEIDSIVDCNETSFLAPDNMTDEIRKHCINTGQQVPETVGEIARVVYQSLADCYRRAVFELEEMTGISYEQIYIVGGGSNAAYLNQLTAQRCGRTICAGPAEATALGNLAAQMMADQIWDNIPQMRQCIRKSCELKLYVPEKRKEKSDQ